MNHLELLFWLIKDIREYDTDLGYEMLENAKAKLDSNLLQEFDDYIDKQGGL